MREIDLSFCPGKKEKLQLEITHGVKLPVWIVCGREDGPVLAVSAGVHGCEYVGIQALRKFYEKIDPAVFCGRLILLPLMNPSGFYQGSKQVMPEDGENLNRVFPGDAAGTLSRQIAYAVEQIIYPLADFILDLHGGDINEALTNLIFFPTNVKKSVAAASRNAAMHLPISYRVRSTSDNGLYSYAAKCEIPSLLLEIGSGGQWSEKEVELCIKCLEALMAHLKMCVSETDEPDNSKQSEAVESVYEEAECDGFWYPAIGLDCMLKRGMTLGFLKDIDGNLIREYTAKFDGIVWYYTTALGVRRGDPVAAYGRCE